MQTSVINDRPVFQKHCSSHGISKIFHLLDENGTLLRYDDLRTNFQELKWLEFYGVLSASKTFMRKLHSTPMRERGIVKGIMLIHNIGILIPHMHSGVRPYLKSLHIRTHTA